MASGTFRFKDLTARNLLGLLFIAALLPAGDTKSFHQLEELTIDSKTNINEADEPYQKAVASPYSCDFENGNTCNWTIANGIKLKWKVAQGAQGAQGASRPEFDHTTQNSEGHYLLMNGSPSYDANGRLVSPEITATGDVCFTFWYQTYGRSVSLEFALVSAGSMLKSFVLKSGTEDPKWKYAQVSFVNDRATKIEIRGYVGYSTNEYIAVDDIVVILGACPPQSQTRPPLDSTCGDWVPFRNEQCIKLIDHAGLHTKEDAEIICKAFTKEFHAEDVPKLITVKTVEKQKFLQKLLFDELATLDNVWLGTDLNKDGVFRWNDGTDLYFTNWVKDTVKERKEDSERNCVQMESREGAYKVGEWDRVNCNKRNVVVCERAQTWTVSEVENIVLSLKLEVEKNKQELERKLHEANQKIIEVKEESDKSFREANEEITRLKNNPVPVGFIYVQLAGQQPPTVLWPQIQWTDVTPSYAGLFFRAEGGNAAPFGQIQDENTKRLEQVEHINNGAHTSPTTIPFNGTWSPTIHIGIYIDGYSWVYTLRLHLSTGEIRPRNQAVRIWQRK